MQLTNEEKLDFILKTSKELGVTAYEFSENTILSAVGAHNILTGDSKTPRTRNLNIMMEYLLQKLQNNLGKNYIEGEDPFKNSVSEALTLEDEIYQRIFVRLKPIFEKQTQEILTLRQDFKVLYDQYLILKNRRPPLDNDDKMLC